MERGACTIRGGVLVHGGGVADEMGGALRADVEGLEVSDIECHPHA